MRFLPTNEQIEAVHRLKKRVFIAGPTVSGNVPGNWQQVSNAGIDGILTDFPLKLGSMLRQGAASK